MKYCPAATPTPIAKHATGTDQVQGTDWATVRVRGTANTVLLKQ